VIFDFTQSWSKLIQNFQLSNDEMANLVVSVDLDGNDLDKVVDEWLAKNTERWEAWK